GRQMTMHRSAYQRALISVVLVWFMADSVGPALFAAPQRYVLLLYGSESDMLGNIVVDRTIRSVLHDAFAVNLDVRSEYFEAAAQPHGPAFVDWLKRKYRGVEFDVVVALGPGAIDLVHDNRDLFPHAHIVCWGRIDNLKNWPTDLPMTAVVAP